MENEASKGSHMLCVKAIFFSSFIFAISSCSEERSELIVYDLYKDLNYSVQKNLEEGHRITVDLNTNIDYHGEIQSTLVAFHVAHRDTGKAIIDDTIEVEMLRQSETQIYSYYAKRKNSVKSLFDVAIPRSGKYIFNISVVPDSTNLKKINSLEVRVYY